MADLTGISNMLGDKNPLVNKNQNQKQESDTNVWLHAPYNVIVKPTQSSTNKGQTTTGQNYQAAIDQYNQLREQATQAQLEYSTPKFKLDSNSGKVTIVGTPETINSPEFKQISKTISDSFKGVDLKDKGMAAAFQATIDKANEQLMANSQNEAYKDFLERVNFSDDAYNNYRYTMQSAEDTNLLKNQNVIKGYDKDGNQVKKTIQEWFDYWKNEYTAEERAKLWMESQKSLYKAMSVGGDENLYGATPYLLMGNKESTNVIQGIMNAINPFDGSILPFNHQNWADAKVTVPIYGFDSKDEMDAFLKAFGGQWKKAGAGLLQKFAVTPWESFGQYKQTGQQVFGKTFDEVKHMPSLSEEDFQQYLELWNSDKKGSDKSRQKRLAESVGEDDAMIARVVGTFDKKSTDGYKFYTEFRDEILPQSSAMQLFNDVNTLKQNIDESNLTRSVYAPGSVSGGVMVGELSRLAAEQIALGVLTGGTLTAENIVKNVFGGTAKAGVEAIGATKLGQALLSKSSLAADLLGALSKGSAAELSGASRVIYTSGKIGTTLLGELGEDAITGIVDDVITGNSLDSQGNLDPDKFLENVWMNAMVLAASKGAKKGLSALGNLAEKSRNMDGVALNSKQKTQLNQLDNAMRATNRTKLVKVDSEGHPVINVDGKDTTLSEISLSNETVKTMAEAGIVDNPTKTDLDIVKDETIPDDVKEKINEAVVNKDTAALKEAIESKMSDAEIREKFPDGKLNVNGETINIDTKVFTAADVNKIDGSSVKNLDGAITQLEGLKKGSGLKTAMESIAGLRRYAKEFASNWKKAVDDYAATHDMTSEDVTLQLKQAAQNLRNGEEANIPQDMMDLWNNNWKPVSDRLINIEQKMTGNRVNNIDFYSRDMVKGSFKPGEDGTFSIDTDINLDVLGADANPFDITASSTAKNQGKLSAEQLELDPYTLAYEYVTSRSANMANSGEGKYFSAMQEAAKAGEYDFSEADARKQLGAFEKAVDDVDKSPAVEEMVKDAETIPTELETPEVKTPEVETVKTTETFDREKVLDEEVGVTPEDYLREVGAGAYKKELANYLGKEYANELLEKTRMLFDAENEVTINRDTLREYGIKLKTSEYLKQTGIATKQEAPSYLRTFLSEDRGVSALELVNRLREIGVNVDDMTPGDAVDKLKDLAKTDTNDNFYQYFLENMPQEAKTRIEDAMLREAGYDVSDDGVISKATETTRQVETPKTEQTTDTTETKTEQTTDTTTPETEQKQQKKAAEEKAIDNAADNYARQEAAFQKKFEDEASKSNAAEMISNNSQYKNKGVRNTNTQKLAGVNYLPNNPFGTLSKWVTDRFMKANAIRISGKGFDTTVYKAGYSLYMEAGTYARKVLIDVKNGMNIVDSIYDVLYNNGFFIEPTEYAVKTYGVKTAKQQALEAAEKMADKIQNGKYANDLISMDGTIKDSNLLAMQLTLSFKNRGKSDFIKLLKKTDMSTLSKGEKKWLNQTTFSIMAESNKKLRSAVGEKTKWCMGKIQGARYRSNMWFNFKNAQLQLTEIQRLFTMNSLGDFADTVTRLVADPEFRSRVTDAAYIYAADSVGQGFSKTDLNGRNMRNAVDAYLETANASTITAKGMITDLNELVGKVDDVALGGIQGAEYAKNYILLAGIIASADNANLSGAQLDNYIRNRFNTEAIAGNEIGKIGINDSALGRFMFMYMGFPIREFQLNVNTLRGGGLSGDTLGAFQYLTKWLGAKTAVWATQAPWGYSLMSVLGIDPFGLTEDNDRPENEDNPLMRALDFTMQYNPFFQGAVTGVITDMYFALRKAHEDAEEEWLRSHESLDGFEWSWADTAWNELQETTKGFIPGYTAYRRVSGEIESLDRGYVMSSTGNRMFETDTDAGNIAMGLLAGRNNTRSGQEYYQTANPITGIYSGGIRGLGQAIERSNPFRNFREFDPIDKETYSDWFNGSYSDEQNWSTGIYDFQDEAQEIIEKYRNKDATSDLVASKYRELNDLRDRVEAYAKAYADKHQGGLSVRKMKDIQKIFKISEPIDATFASVSEGYDYTPDEKARNFIAAGNFPSAYGYTGPTSYNRDAKIEQYNNPELYNLLQRGKYGVQSNVPRALQEADKTVIKTAQGEMSLKDYRDQLNALKTAEYNKANPDYDRIEEIQREYLKAFDSVVRPILETYGSGIIDNNYLSGRSSDIMQEFTRMLSGWIPSEDYRIDKKGKKIYQSTPYMTVDIKKWLQKNYSGYSGAGSVDKKASDRIEEIKKDLNAGKTNSAKTKARSIISDMDDWRISLTDEEYELVKELAK